MQALLIDGDNLSVQHAAAVIAVAPAAEVRRVYCGTAALKPWAAVEGLTCIHAAEGRNSADIRLAVDAVDLWHAGCRAFTLTTSDSGLASVATRLREGGARVTVVGEAKSPARLRLSGNSFVELVEISPPLPSPPTRPALPRLSELEQQVVTLLQNEGMAGMVLTGINGAMHKQGVRISTLPEKNWRAWLAARPALFALDPRGPEARVRLTLA